MMRDPDPVERQRLSDDLAQRVRHLIRARGYERGDRLPSIAEMSRRFGVSHPTLREALRKLETLRYIEIRHGSGIYVGAGSNSPLIVNPVYEGAITKKVLLDLVEARIPIEMRCVALAAEHATEQQIEHMRKQLALAEEALDDPTILREANFEFHGSLAKASGNQILHQLLEVLGSVIHEEQRVILDAANTRRRFHEEHVGILDAVAGRVPQSASARMQEHLEGVREIIQQRPADLTPAGEPAQR